MEKLHSDEYNWDTHQKVGKLTRYGEKPSLNHDKSKSFKPNDPAFARLLNIFRIGLKIMLTWFKCLVEREELRKGANQNGAQANQALPRHTPLYSQAYPKFSWTNLFPIFKIVPRFQLGEFYNYFVII
nr:hypothetical protein [Dinophyceae sp. MRD-151]